MSQESIDAATRQLVENHRALIIARNECETLFAISQSAYGAYMAATGRFKTADERLMSAGAALQAELSKP